MGHSSTNTARHARFDCAQGVSEASMLAACIDAAGDQRQDILNYVQSCLQNGLPDLLRDDWSLSSSHQSDHHGALFLIVSTQNETPQDNGGGKGNYKLPGLRHMLKDGVEKDFNDWPSLRALILFDTKAECIPFAIRKTVVDVLKLIVDAQLKVYGQQSSSLGEFREVDLLSSAVAVFAILSAMSSLQIESTSCSRLPLAEGQVLTDNGLVPETSPLTLELMVGMPIYVDEQADACVVSPTAAALLRVLTSASSKSQSGTAASNFKLCAQGLGGSESDSNHCITRVMLGELSVEQKPLVNTFQVRSNEAIGYVTNSNRWKVDSLIHIEANLDDTTPEYLAFAVELLLKNGAVDAWIAPIVMKKGRPAYTLHCLCFDDSNDQLPESESTSDKLMGLIFRHTSTLGARWSRVVRAALQRSQVTVQAPFPETARKGLVDVKVGYLDGEIVSIKAEFDHCRQISDETGVPLKDISDLAVRLAREQLDSEK